MYVCIYVSTTQYTLTHTFMHTYMHTHTHRVLCVLQTDTYTRFLMWDMFIDTYTHTQCMHTPRYIYTHIRVVYSDRIRRHTHAKTNKKKHKQKTPSVCYQKRKTHTHTPTSHANTHLHTHQYCMQTHTYTHRNMACAPKQADNSTAEAMMVLEKTDSDSASDHVNIEAGISATATRHGQDSVAVHVPAHVRDSCVLSWVEGMDEMFQNEVRKERITLRFLDEKMRVGITDMDGQQEKVALLSDASMLLVRQDSYTHLPEGVVELAHVEQALNAILDKPCMVDEVTTLLKKHSSWRVTSVRIACRNTTHKFKSPEVHVLVPNILGPRLGRENFKELPSIDLKNPGMELVIFTKGTFIALCHTERGGAGPMGWQCLACDKGDVASRAADQVAFFVCLSALKQLEGMPGNPLVGVGVHDCDRGKDNNVSGICGKMKVRKRSSSDRDEEDICEDASAHTESVDPAGHVSTNCHTSTHTSIDPAKHSAESHSTDTTESNNDVQAQANRRDTVTQTQTSNANTPAHPSPQAHLTDTQAPNTDTSLGSNPQPSIIDINSSTKFIALDPMCGVGTFPLAFQYIMRRYYPSLLPGVKIIGADAALESIEQARRNCSRSIAPGENEIVFHVQENEDQVSIPLPCDCVDVIVVDPPWGHRHCTFAYINKMMIKWMSEWVRVLKPRTGVLAVVTIRTRHFELQVAPILKHKLGVDYLREPVMFDNKGFDMCKLYIMGKGLETSAA
jgi:hypothetical protein